MPPRENPDDSNGEEFAHEAFRIAIEQPARAFALLTAALQDKDLQRAALVAHEAEPEMEHLRADELEEALGGTSPGELNQQRESDTLYLLSALNAHLNAITLNERKGAMDAPTSEPLRWSVEVAGTTHRVVPKPPSWRPSGTHHGVFPKWAPDFEVIPSRKAPSSLSSSTT